MNRKKVKLQAQAIMESKSLAEAYKKTHNCSDDTARKNGYKMLKNPEILAEVEKIMEKVKPVEVSKTNLVKMLTMVVHNWQAGEERTSDFLRAIELLARLVPEFSDKHSIEHYQNMSDEELSRTLSDRLRNLNQSSTN